MPETWGFSRRTADKLYEMANGPRTISRARTQRNKTPWTISGMELFKTPSGGIPACTGTGPFTLGSGTCLVCTVDPDDDDVVNVGTETQVIKNIVDQAIAGDVLIKAAKVGGIWVVDVASCGT